MSHRLSDRHISLIMSAAAASDGKVTLSREETMAALEECVEHRKAMARPIALFLSPDEADTLRKLPDGSDAWASDAPEVLTLDAKVRDICERLRRDVALYHETTLLGVVYYDATGTSRICAPDPDAEADNGF